MILSYISLITALKSENRVVEFQNYYNKYRDLVH